MRLVSLSSLRRYPAMDKDKLLYSIPDTCRILSISRSFLYQMISTGRIEKPLKIGKRSLFTRQSLESFVEQLHNANQLQVTR
ncbi:MAG: helix-turn-helix domain-containing protein [Planctomycetes bacterium]|nr:helix-turn-helix domain-containing protein [Planctomycetota bacterium]